MQILSSLSFAIIFITGAYLIGFGALSVVKPDLAARFLLGFVRTAKLHYLELVLRVLIGSALINYSPVMLFATWVEYAGWVLVGTSFLMALAPWRLHQRFAQKFVPYANRYLKLVGYASFFLGIFSWASLRFIELPI